MIISGWKLLECYKNIYKKNNALIISKVIIVNIKKKDFINFPINSVNRNLYKLLSKTKSRQATKNNKNIQQK